VSEFFPVIASMGQHMNRLAKALYPGLVALACFLFGYDRALGDTLYVSCQGDGFTANSGKIFQIDTASGHGSYFASGLVDPWGLALDGSGNLYAAMNYSGGGIDKFDASGNASVFNSLASNSQPWYVAFDRSGNLFTSGYFTDITGVKKFDTGGHVSNFANMSNPRNIAFDRAGNLYLLNGSSSSIYRFDTNGNQSVFASVGGATGLAFDTSGNLYTADSFNGAIEKISTNGQVSLFLNSGLSSPSALAFDSAGNLYVANYSVTDHPNTGTIEEFDTHGNGRIIASGLDFPVAFAVQVPEPATWALVALGSIALLRNHRMRRRSS
jgi:sugar lactone lactonase YvrE